MVYHGWCDKHNRRKTMDRNGGAYCHSCFLEEVKGVEIAPRKSIKSDIKRTSK